VRENRTHGSEGGEARALLYPYHAVKFVIARRLADAATRWIATAFGLAMTGFDRAKRHMFMERLKAVAIVTMTAAVFGPPKGISQWPRNFLRKAHLASLPHWILDAYAE
jgi:hypothetical protein